MKKILKRVLLGAGIVILILGLVLLGFYLKIRSELKSMTQIETGLVADDVYAIKDSFANMFLIKDSNEYIAVDAGYNQETVSAELNKLGIDPALVKVVLLTHTDADHVGALKLFSNAKVYLSRPEEQMINGQKSKFLFFGNSIPNKDYILLDDGQTLQFNKTKVLAVLTPGHTSGSMCYLADEKYLFTGDALSLREGRLDKVNKFFSMDHNTANISIAKITKFPYAEFIFTGHWGYTDNYKNAVINWKE
jgi:hydroxyacylglutathione hydrolase